MLKFGLKSNKYYKVSKNIKFKEVVLDFFSGKAGDIKYASIFFNGRGEKFENIKRLKLVFKNKKTISLKLDFIKPSVVFKKDNFHFKVPKGTRVYTNSISM